MIAINPYKDNGWSDLKFDQDTCPIAHTILAVINPLSGSGKALKLFKTVIEPEWKKQGISYRILITEYANHSTQLLSQDSKIQRFESIVAIGGDGTLAEIIRGIDKNKILNDVRSTIKLGIIPVGSGNGLFKSLKPDVSAKTRVLEAAKMAAITASKTMDLVEITQNKEKRTAFLAITLGLIADIDILSEPLRCLGDFRFTLGAIWSLWKNKVYKVELSYLQNKLEKTDQQAWSKISGNFTLLMISNTSHCSSNAHTAPGAKINDGYLHVTAVKTVSTWTRIKLLLGLESGEWVQHPSVIQFKTRSLRIDSMSDDAILTLDGEKIASQPLECRIQHNALRILCN